MVFHKYVPEAASFDSHEIIANVPSVDNAAKKLSELTGVSSMELNKGTGRSNDELFPNKVLDADVNSYDYDTQAQEIEVVPSEDPELTTADAVNETISQGVQDSDGTDKTTTENDYLKEDEEDENDYDEVVENGLHPTSEVLLRSTSSVNTSIGFDEITVAEKIRGTNTSANRPNHPVDSGYAWVVLIACFVLQFILLGYTKSLGVFFVEFQSRFSASASTMSLIIGSGEAVGSLGSLLVMGFLLKYLSPRVACYIGTLSLAVGIVANSYLTNVNYLFLSHGVCFGMTMAALYGPALLCLTQYFHKRRALATSLATCGTSLGGIIFPLLTRHLLDTYAFQGGVLMTAGVVMQAFIFCTLLTPIDSYPERPFNEETKSNQKRDVRPQNAILKLLYRIKSSSLSKRNGGNSKQEERIENVSEKESEDLFRSRSGSSSSKRCYNKAGTVWEQQSHQNLKAPEESLPLKKNEDNLMDYLGDLKTIPEVNSHVSLEQFGSKIGGRQNVQLVDAEQCQPPFTQKLSVKSDSAFFEPSSPKLRGIALEVTKKKQLTSVGDGSRFSNKYHQLSIPPPSTHRYRTPLETGQTDQSLLAQEVNSSLSVTVEIADLRASLVRHQLSRSSASIFCSTSSLHTNFADIMSMDQEQFASRAKQLGLKPITFFQRFCTSCGKSSIIRAMSFWVLTVFFFFSCIGQAVPQMFIPALAKERGLSDEDAAFFLSLMNMLDFPSRLLAGVVVNCGLIKPTGACVIPMLCVGLVGQFTSLMNSYESILLLVVVYGLCLGTYFAMQSMIVIQVLGFDNFAPSIGFYYLVMGSGGAMSYPIAGILRDSTNTYSSTYHFLATAELIAFTMLLLVPLTRRLDVRRGVLKEEDVLT